MPKEGSSKATVTRAGSANGTVRGRSYTTVYSFLEFNPDGSFAGNTNVWSNVRLSADGNTFSSTTTAEITDADGNVLFTACGTRGGRRL